MHASLKELMPQVSFLMRRLIYGYRSLASNRLGVFINQFPDEQVITVKDLLVTTCRRAGNQRIDPETLRASPKWLPVSYNLQTELAEFVSYFQHREEK